MERRKSPSIYNTIGVMCLFVCSNPVYLVMSGLAKIAESYPGVSYTMVTLLTSVISLTAFPVSLLSGVIVGRYIKYKTVSVIAMLCIIVGGVAPVFLADFYLVLVMRALVGAGVGLMFPLGNPVIMRLYDEKKATVFMGFGSAVINLFGVFLLLLGGVLSDIDVRYVWLAHALWLLPLMLVIAFMPEPGAEAPTAEAPNVEEPAAAAPAAAKAKQPDIKMAPAVYLISLAFMVIMMCSYCANINMSLIVETEGLGGAAVTGVISALFTAGGVAAGVVFAPVIKCLGRFTCAAMTALSAGGLLLAGTGNSVPLLMLSMLIGGLAIYTLSPACMKLFGCHVPPEGLGLASGIFSACWNLGGFLSTPFMGLVTSLSGSSNPRLPLLAGAVILLVLCVFWLACEIIRRPKPVADASSSLD